MCLPVHTQLLPLGATRRTRGGLSRRRSFSPSSGTDIYTDVPFAFAINNFAPKIGRRCSPLSPFSLCPVSNGKRGHKCLPKSHGRRLSVLVSGFGIRVSPCGLWRANHASPRRERPILNPVDAPVAKFAHFSLKMRSH